MISNQRGSAVIEMAIVLPIFIFLFIAIVDFGLYFNKRNVAQAAAYNAAKSCNTEENLDGDVIQSGTPGLVTLETLNIISNGELKNTPTCQIISSSASYYEVQMTIGGNILSPFTSLSGLYDFTVTGIATKTNSI